MGLSKVIRAAHANIVWIPIVLNAQMIIKFVLDAQVATILTS